MHLESRAYNALKTFAKTKAPVFLTPVGEKKCKKMGDPSAETEQTEQQGLAASQAAACRLFFEQGILGFGNHQEYVLAPAPKAVLKPFQVLIHAHNPDVHFLLLSFEDAGAELTPALRQEVAQKLSLEESTLKGYYLVTSTGRFPGELTFSINKRAPLFISESQKKGGQYILRDAGLPLAFILTHLSYAVRQRLQK